MLQGNNSALLGAQAVVDTSGFADQFRDGQKLRQEYDARQQTKALNELMGIQDFNERIAKARTHKYAGALVPELQKYEEARQKAALDNLGASADIGKTYAETGKLGAESGKIGAETTGLVRENTAGVQNDISALAVTQNPKLFALGIGEMVKQELISPERADMMLKMVASDQPNAAAVLQSMVMANPELAKLFKPEIEYTNLGDRVESQVYDPLAGTVTGKGGYNIGQSPDNKATNATSRANNINTVEGQKYASDNTYEASVYGTDVRSADTRYNTDVVSNDKGLKLDQDGKIAWAKISQDQQKLDNPQTNRKPRAVAATKEMSKHLTNIKNNAYTIRNAATWVQKIQSGELNLGAMANSMNSLANRTGVDSLGGNPAAYAEFKSNMVKLASDALRLNAGVQTDMDYKRALEEMQAGTYIPRNNKTAIALLTKIVRDFDSKNRAEYSSYADYKREYDGVILPEYGRNSRSSGQPAKQQPTKSSVGQAIGKKVFGGS